MINQVTLIGRVGQDPEIKHFDGGNSVANLSLATSEKYRDREGNQVEDTEWHRLVIWGKLSEIVEKYVKKGNLIAVNGKIKTETYEKNGEKRYATNIVVRDFKMLGGGDNPQNQPVQNPKPQAQNNDFNQDDSLPF